jgi:hypothetical protein
MFIKRKTAKDFIKNPYRALTIPVMVTLMKEAVRARCERLIERIKEQEHYVFEKSCILGDVLGLPEEEQGFVRKNIKDIGYLALH